MSMGAFGTGVLFIESEGDELRYRSVHISEVCIAENAHGLVDTVFRKALLTARQALERFGAEVLPEKIVDDARERPDALHEFLHVVLPNDAPDRMAWNYRGMRFSSVYLCLLSREIVSEGGFRTFPYAVGRYVTGPKEIWGRSPAMTVLPEIKMVQEMTKTILKAGQKALDPPLLLQEDGALSAFDLRPGALNFGGVDDAGNPTVQALEFKGDIAIGDEMIERRQKAINEAFLVTLTQVLVATPRMTAAEALLRSQEKARLLAPTMGRQQSEFLGPMVERELDLLDQMGWLPPMPDALKAAGGLVDVDYTSPLNKAQRAEEGLAIVRAIQNATTLAQVDPTIMFHFDGDAIVRELAEINGMPAKLLRPVEEVLRMKEMVKALNPTMLAQAGAMVGGQAVKDLSQLQMLQGLEPLGSGTGFSLKDT
jgi:hypothetical protein